MEFFIRKSMHAALISKNQSSKLEKETLTIYIISYLPSIERNLNLVIKHAV